MSGAVDDTHPTIRAMMVEGYRRMTPTEKFRRVEELNEAVLQLAAARIRAEHPGLDDRELRLCIASLWLDRATMVRAFGWDPALHG